MIPLFIENSLEHQHLTKALIENFGFEVCAQKPEQGYFLSLSAQILRLCHPHAHGDIFVDFAHGKSAHRRQFGGGKGQLIAKAVGLRTLDQPLIFDATAGLGQDAFVLASLGATVHMHERSPIAAALLADGLRRAHEHDEISAIVSRMSLIFGDSAHILQNTEQRYDVIYIDPMFPERKKNTAVKKEMSAFQHCIGDDWDAAQLVALAQRHARHRVVVKRPKHGDFLVPTRPHAQIIGKSTRFDIYSPNQNTQNNLK